VVLDKNTLVLDKPTLFRYLLNNKVYIVLLLLLLLLIIIIIIIIKYCLYGYWERAKK